MTQKFASPSPLRAATIVQVIYARRMVSVAGMQALAVALLLLVTPGDVFAQGAGRAARGAPRAAPAGVHAVPPLPVETRPNATHGA